MILNKFRLKIRRADFIESNFSRVWWMIWACPRKLYHNVIETLWAGSGYPLQVLARVILIKHDQTFGLAVGFSLLSLTQVAKARPAGTRPKQ